MKPLPNPSAIRTYNANGTASVQRLTGTAPNPSGIHSLPSAPVLCRYSWYSSTILRSVLPPSASLLPGLRFWLLIYHAFCKFRQLSHHTSTILLHRNPSIIRTLPNITPCGTLHSGGILNFPRGTPPDVFCSVSLHKKRPRRGESGVRLRLTAFLCSIAARVPTLFEWGKPQTPFGMGILLKNLLSSFVVRDFLKGRPLHLCYIKP